MLTPALTSLCKLVALACLVAHADVQRIAVFIGIDHGLHGERPLRYASRDAMRMAEAFRQARTIDEDQIHLLVNTSVDKVRASLESVRTRVREQRESGTESMVFIYFSGHGGAEGLHIKGGIFSRQELFQYLESLESDLKVVILDACESGDLIRQKGGRLVEGSKIVRVDKLASKGSILISSSSQGEMAQESDEYKGAVFTHHFLNGMKGLADYDRDKTVRLMEAFDYARVSTKKEEIQGKIAQQNPEFDFDLTGESDPVVAQLDNQQCQMLLHNMPSGPLEIYNGNTLKLESKVWLTGQDSVTFHAPSNKYILTYRDMDASRILEVDLTWKRQQTIRPESFRRKINSLLYGKGGKSLDLDFHGIQYSLRRLSLFDEPTLHQVGYVHRGYRTRQILGLTFADAFMDGGATGIDNSMRIFGAGYSIAVPVANAMYGQLLIGGEASWHRAIQRIRDNRFGESPVVVNGKPLDTDREVQANLYHLALPFECEVYLPMRIWLSVSVATGTYFYRGDGASTNPLGRIAFEPGMAIGHQF